jgi:hypothetical protein
MTIQELSSRLLGFPVREIPRTPPLNKFGGEFENGWEYFFDDLNNFLQQGISAYKVDTNLWVSRVGSVVTVTGTVGTTEVDLGVRPVCENDLIIDGVMVSASGKISCTSTRNVSLSFIAR